MMIATIIRAMKSKANTPPITAYAERVGKGGEGERRGREGEEKGRGWRGGEGGE